MSDPHRPAHRGASRVEAGRTETTRVETGRLGDRTDQGSHEAHVGHDHDHVTHDREHHVTHDRTAVPVHSRDDSEARDKFGGFNWGACFFGWLVAIGLSILLSSIIGAVASAIGDNANVTQTEAERQAGTIGIVAAIVLVAVLVIGYYAGGYVAGRMSRFDGGRQGLGVWLIGLLVTLLAVGLGVLFGSEYNILDRVNLPNLPVSGDEIGWGALATAVALVLLTALAAVFGGKVGHRYHDRVDRAVRHSGV